MKFTCELKSVYRILVQKDVDKTISKTEIDILRSITEHFRLLPAITSLYRLTLGNGHLLVDTELDHQDYLHCVRCGGDSQGCEFFEKYHCVESMPIKYLREKGNLK